MASRSLGTLTLDLVAKVGGFTSGMTAAERAADKSLSAIEKRAYQFGQTLGKGLKVAGGLAVAGIAALAASLQVTINGLDELSKSAQKVGITTEELSKLAYAGELADVSLETLVGSLGKLTKAQAAALDTSSKQARVFEALGIAVKDAEGNLRSSSDVLGDFAEKFQQLGGSPEAIAAGFQIFGKSFQELIPLLKDGREGIEGAADELERFGGVISTDAGKAAEEFNDNLSRLKVQFQAIFAQVAQQLLPTLVQLSKDLSETAQNGNLAANAVTLITAAVDIGVGALKLYQAAVDNVGIAIEQAVKSYEGWVEVTKNVASLGFADGGVVEGFKKITDAADDAAAARTRLASIRNTPAIEAAEGIDFSQGAPLSPDEMAAQNRRLQTALGGVTKAKKEKTEATKKETEADKAFRENILEINELIDEMARDTQSDLFQNAQRRQEDFEALIGDIQTQNDLLGQTAEQQDLINTARQYGIDLASEEGKILAETLNQYHENQAAIQDTITVMDGLRDASKGFLQDLKDGVGIVDAIKNAFDNLIQVIFDAVAQNLIEQLLGPSGTTQGGAAGGGWAQILGAFFGASGRATGGSVNSGGMYRVNEQEPELLTVGNRDYLMMGNGSGMVTPSAGGGITQNITYVNPQLNDWQSESQRRAELASNIRVASSRNGS